jgi:hypothetical protein
MKVTIWKLVVKKGEMSRKFWSENLKGRDHLEDLDVNESIIL